MEQFRIFGFAIIILGAVSLTACASTSKKTNDKIDISQLSYVDDQGNILASAPRDQRLRDRLAGGAVQGAALAAKGTAIAAKSAIIVTAEGTEMVAKGAVAGARMSGKAVVETGEIIVNGTRRTASGMREGVVFVTRAPATKDAASPVGHKTFTDAALSPLSDFNIRKRERPEILISLKDDGPYQLEADASCEWYDIRVAELNEVLGDDYDVEKEKSSALKKVGKRGKGAAISGVASAAGTYIPGRSIIRTLSGAKARQKHTRQIYQKGVARRSFLKGVAMSKGCEGY